MLAALGAVAIDLARGFQNSAMTGFDRVWFVNDTVFCTTGEAFRRGPELHERIQPFRCDKVVARARRSSGAAVLQV